MKLLIVVALSLLLVLVCVVYLHREQYWPFPAPPVVVSFPTAHAPHHKINRPLKSKTLPSGPIDISGPLKNRALIHWVLPDYPDWAEEQGITGTYRVKIWVTPSGDVTSFTEPQQLSADPRLDDKAMDAIRQWRFTEEPNSFGEQWGIITVRFSLLSKLEDQPEATIQGAALGNQTSSGAWECIRTWVGEAKKQWVYICKLHSQPAVP